MLIKFVTIQGSGNSGYKAVIKSFPTIEGSMVKLSIPVNSLKKCIDKHTAEVAAKKFSELKSLPYVPENTSVMTSIPFGTKGFLALEFTSNGEVIGQGSVVDKDSSLAQATQVANQRGLPLLGILPF